LTNVVLYVAATAYEMKEQLPSAFPNTLASLGQQSLSLVDQIYRTAPDNDWMLRQANLLIFTCSHFSSSW